MATKAYLEAEGGRRLPCLFNPNELVVALSNRWSSESVPGYASRRLRFAGSGSGSIDVELFLDTTDTGEPVTKHTDTLLSLMKIDTNLPGYSAQRSNGRPAWVRFHWGRFHSTRCVVEQLDVRFVYFAQDGTPLRARAQLHLRQYEPDQQWPPQNPTSGTPAPARSHQVQRGEHLALLAARYYGDATQWRRLAEANGIRDPFRLQPGAVLDVPDPTEQS